MEQAAAAGGHALLLSAVGCLYVAWRHPVLDYAKELTVDVPMMGPQAVHLNATRTLFVKYEDAEPVVPGLWAKQSYVAASMVVLFGVALPLLKVLLTLRTDAKSAGWARLLARWTLVDALAEALVVGLLIAAGVTAELRVGFAAFLGYVVLSHAALALLRAPEAPAPPQRAVPRAVVFGLAFAFFVLLWVGMRQTALRLWMEDSSLLAQLEERIRANPASKMLGLLGQTVEGLAKQLAKQIPPVRGEVSLVSALSLLARGDATTKIGSAALLVLALVLPVLDVALSLAAFTADRLPLMDAPLRSLRPVVHDLASLDVLVVGVCICCAVTENVQNLSAAPAPGLAMLGAAAVCQVALHHVTQALPLAKGKEGKDLV